METGYGAGRHLGRVGTIRTLEHGGNLIGGMTHVLLVPEHGLFVAILANSEPAPTASPELLAVNIAGRLLQGDPDPYRCYSPRPSSTAI